MFNFFYAFCLRFLCGKSSFPKASWVFFKFITRESQKTKKQKHKTTHTKQLKITRINFWDFQVKKQCLCHWGEQQYTSNAQMPQNFLLESVQTFPRHILFLGFNMFTSETDVIQFKTMWWECFPSPQKHFTRFKNEPQHWGRIHRWGACPDP